VAGAGDRSLNRQVLEAPIRALSHHIKEVLVENVVARPAPQTQIDFGSVMQLPYAESEVGFRLPDGRSERVLLETAYPTEFVVHEPTLVESGAVYMPLEILKFELVGTSELVWPGETVKVFGGVDSIDGGRPIYGSVHLPANTALEEGADSEQQLYLTMQTPLGLLRNETPVVMRGKVYRVPPIGSRFESQGDVALYDVGGEKRLTVWACANAS
jgi:hypothetical protein